MGKFQLQHLLDEDAPSLPKKKSKVGHGHVQTKAEKKAKKLEIMERKRQAGVKASRDDDLESMEKARAGSAFTSEWSEQLSDTKREALPVIKQGKVVRVLVDAHDGQGDTGGGNEGEEDSELNEFKVNRMRKGKAKRDAMAALREKKNAEKGVKDTKAGGGSGDSDDGDGSDDEEEADYDFRPEFKSKLEAMEDYGDLDESSQNDAVVTKRQQKKKRKDQGDSDDSDSDEDMGSDEDEDAEEGNKADKNAEKKPREKISKNAQITRKRMLGLAKMSTPRLKAHIATISRQILASPEDALKRAMKKIEGEGSGKGKDGEEDDDSDDEEEQYKMTDLFDILTANSPNAKQQKESNYEAKTKGHGKASTTDRESDGSTRIFPTSIIECTMLSLLLIFKDICPGYKIRPPQENASMQDVRLKKETKRLRDYEFALLGAYQRYLKFLSGCVSTGLGNPRNSVPDWSSSALLGVSALRCQGELLKAIPFFNFRVGLVNSIASRAAQPSAEVHSVACTALEGLFEKDKEWDASLEAVKAMGGVLSERKSKIGTIPESFLKTLWRLQLHVRAEDAKDLKKQAKKEKRKRKRAGTDDVATKMLESNSQHDKLVRDKMQAQCLHEVLLLYFRILKGKIGFRLLPTALEGLSRVSHLINTDTVEDLVAIMRDLLDNPASVPPQEVRLRCLLCAFRTLNGPGETLGLDMDFFTSSLLQLLRELQSDFQRWDQVLECVDICMVRKREERTAPVVHFVKSLFFIASAVPSAGTGVSALAMAHKILLRYPRIRARLRVFGLAESRSLQEDDEVGDLAMVALKAESGDNGKVSDAFALDGTSDDGTWMLPLLRLHPDSAFSKTVAAVCDREIVSVPLRFETAAYSLATLTDRMDSALDRTPSTLRAALGRHLGAGAGALAPAAPAAADDAPAGKKAKPKLDKRQRLLQKKLAGGAAAGAASASDLERVFISDADVGATGASFASLFGK